LAAGQIFWLARPAVCRFHGGQGEPGPTGSLRFLHAAKAVRDDPTLLIGPAR